MLQFTNQIGICTCFCTNYMIYFWKVYRANRCAFVQQNMNLLPLQDTADRGVHVSVNMRCPIIDTILYFVKLTIDVSQRPS